MEKLKEKDRITAPDERQKHFVVIDAESGKFRPLSLNDIFDNAFSIQLHDGVPDEIRSHFATAQNLLVYSWFYYPFTVTAKFMAYVSLEFALKKKFCKPKERIPLKKLLEKAVKEGLIKDEGFSRIRRRTAFIPELNDEDNKDVNRYAKILMDTIPSLRNHLAHGSSHLNDGTSTVRVCAEIINQLYPNQNRGEK